MTGRAVAALTGTVAMAALIACTPDPLSPYQPTDSQRQLQNWFGLRFESTMPPIYCYATLAEPDCYAEPVPGWERRLIAYGGPAPDRPAAGPVTAP